MPPLVIGLLGSPLLNGNTAILLDRALDGARDAGCETEKIAAAHLDFKPCMEIFYCVENPTCKLNDDMIPHLEKFRTLDGLIVASPIMTMGIPGGLKSFIDRFQVFFMAKYVRKSPLVPAEKRGSRKGLFISIAGMALPSVFDGAKMTVKAFFTIIDCAYWGEILTNDMDHIHDIQKRPDVMEAAYRKGYELGIALGGKPLTSPKQGISDNPT
ncbi:MAG: flavodoxin family protein [Methanomicrobiales archaeon]|nr:flavodoxin family protein [Methanomicrobiales archaeon]